MSSLEDKLKVESLSADAAPMNAKKKALNPVVRKQRTPEMKKAVCVWAKVSGGLRSGS